MEAYADRGGLDCGVGGSVEGARCHRERRGPAARGEHRPGQRDEQSGGDQQSGVEMPVPCAKADRQRDEAHRDDRDRRELGRSDTVTENARGERHREGQAAGAEGLHEGERRQRHGDDLTAEADPADYLPDQPGGLAKPAGQRAVTVGSSALVAAVLEDESDVDQRGRDERQQQCSH